MIFQVGYDKQGLPIGLQIIGRPWGEASILRLASAVEVQVLTSSRHYIYGGYRILLTPFVSLKGTLCNEETTCIILRCFEVKIEQPSFQD